MTDVRTRLWEVDPFDEATLVELVDFANLVRVVDEPWYPPQLLRPLAGELRYGWDDEPERFWLLREGDRADGAIIGRLGLYLPERDNRHRASVHVTVHPEHRRRGVGRALFEAAQAIVGAAGRRLLTGESVDAPASIAFAESLGFRRGSVEIHRRQDLAEVDRDRIEALRSEAEKAATGYRLLRMAGPVPEEWLERVAAMTAAINDAPTDAMDVEDEVFDADRIRHFDRAQQGWGRRIYRLVAQRCSDGALAGQTIMARDEDQPDWGEQYDTSVVQEHRGHRLGLWLKTEMLRWLAEAEPEMRYIDTWNAESNKHMIAINEQLGYRVVSRYLEWQRATRPDDG